MSVDTVVTCGGVSLTGDDDTDVTSLTTGDDVTFLTGDDDDDVTCGVDADDVTDGVDDVTVDDVLSVIVAVFFKNLK
jgi:hypothetical protein